VTSILVLALLLAQQAAPPEKCTLAGTVVDSVTGMPLGKAIVVAERGSGGDDDASTMTDAKGNFVMIDVEPGQYHLAAQRRGYTEGYYGARRASGTGTAIALTAGEKAEDLRIKLVPFGVIAGVVRDTDGEPLEGAEVGVLKSFNNFNTMGEPRMLLVGNATTDDLGQYRIADLSPGKYYVGAAPELRRGKSVGVDHSVKSSDSPEVPVAAMYPGTANPANARPVEVAPGSRLTGVDITIVRSRLYKVAVHVEAPPGLRASASLSYAFADIGGPGNAREDKANGDLVISGVPPGTYVMHVVVSGSDQAQGASDTRVPMYCETNIPVTVDRHDVEGLRVAVSGCAVAEGHVTVDGADRNELGGSMVDFDHGRRNAAIKPDGSFATSLSTGASSLDLSRITRERPLYVKSIRSGNQDVLRNGFTVATAERIELEVVLGSDGGRVDGVVSDADDKPLAGATVVLIPNDPALRTRLDFIKDSVTDQSGHFELKNAAPGEYKLFAWDDIEPGSWFDPDVVPGVETKGEPVTVKAKDLATVKLHVIQ